MMTNPADELQDHVQGESRKTPGLPLMAGLAGVIFLATAGLLVPGMAVWEANIIRLSGALAIACALLGILWIMRNRERLGVSVAVSMMLVHVFLLAITLQGVGLLLLLVPVPLAWAFISGLEGEKLKNRFIYTATGTGVAALLFDIFRSNAGSLNNLRESATPFLVGAIILLAFFNGYYFVRQFEHYSLRSKLVFSFVIVTVASLGLMGVLNERSTRATLTRDAQASLLAAAQQTQDSVINFFNNALATVENEAALPVFLEYLLLPPGQRTGSLQRDSVQKTLDALRGKDAEYISSYALLDLNGRTLADTDRGEIGKSKAEREYFSRVVSSGEPFLSGVVISETSGEGSIYLSTPVKLKGADIESPSQVLGVLRVRYDADILQALIEQSNGLVGKDSFAVLFDEHFIHLAHGTAPETIFKTVLPLELDEYQKLINERRIPNLPTEQIFLNLPDLAQSLREASESDTEIQFFEATDVATGDRQLEAVATQFEWYQDWILVFFQPQDIFLAPAENQSRFTVLLSVAIASAVVVAGFALAQVLANPIVQLTRAAERVSGGDFSTQAEVGGDDEIGRLAETFNEMTTQLRVLVMSLEDQVAARTKDLEFQARNLQIAAEIARDATAENELEAMLIRAANLTRSRFNFHYVGIYLADGQRKNAYLRAATGEKGGEMVTNKHHIELSSEDVIGEVMRKGEAQITNTYRDEGGSMMKDSTSQLVVPFKVGDEILGVMDLQSKSPEDFDESQVALFQTMADQLAIALQKADLREEIEQALKELETAYGRFTRSEWRGFLPGTKKASGYAFDQISVKEIKEDHPEVRRMWKTNESVILSGEGETGEKLMVPLKIRGETIGVLSMAFNTSGAPRESQELVEEIASRLALVMENARLLEAAQQRVERQRLVGEVSDQIRGTLDLESILKTAAEKIRESLDLPEVSLRLVKPSTGEPQQTTNGSSEAV